MAIEFKLPEVSEGVESADIAEIHVAEGDSVEAEQIVMELETEKAVVELPCPHAGKITKLHVSPGDTVNVGETLLTIEESSEAAGDDDEDSGEPEGKEKEKKDKKEKSAKAKEKSEEAEGDDEADEESADKKKTKKKKKKPPAEEEDEGDEAEEKPSKKKKPRKKEASEAEDDEDEEEPEKEPEPEASVKSTGPEKARASLGVARAAEPDEDDDAPPAPAAPATRRLARELGVDLHQVEGSGPGGRITTGDVQKYVRGLSKRTTAEVPAPAAAPDLPDFNKFGPIERQKLSKLAKTSAWNLSMSWQIIPHVTQHDLADITELESARKRFSKTAGDSAPKVTMTAILVKAIVGALKEFPQFNSSLDAGAGELVLKRYYHIGVAVDTEHGLLVPVIHDVDQKSILDVAAELGDLAARARDRKLSLDEMQGATFTITNLGGIGGTAFTPIINYPEVAILGVSRTRRQLHMDNGQPEERLMLPLSLSYDHRVINGADAARFVVKLSQILSDFFQMMVEC